MRMMRGYSKQSASIAVRRARDQKFKFETSSPSSAAQLLLEVPVRVQCRMCASMRGVLMRAAQLLLVLWAARAQVYPVDAAQGYRWGRVPQSCECEETGATPQDCAYFSCKCVCDVRAGACDYGCCCDPDCAADQVCGVIASPVFWPHESIGESLPAARLQRGRREGPERALLLLVRPAGQGEPQSADGRPVGGAGGPRPGALRGQDQLRRRGAQQAILAHMAVWLR